MRYVNLYWMDDSNSFYLNFFWYFVLIVLKRLICVNSLMFAQNLIYILSYIYILNSVVVLEGRETNSPLFWRYRSDYQREIPKLTYIDPFPLPEDNYKIRIIVFRSYADKISQNKQDKR